MEHMRRIAYETVLRACGFASLAIFCVMIGMSFDARLAFQAGGFLTTIMAFVLILKAREALTKDYRKTEMWLYLDKNYRPPEAYAQWASATILRDTYLTFAMWTALVSIAMWAIALMFSLLGFRSTLTNEAAPAPVQARSQPLDAISAARNVSPASPSVHYQIVP